MPSMGQTLSGNIVESYIELEHVESVEEYTE